MWPFDPPKECQECHRVKQDLKLLRLDWEELLDKVQRWMGRHNARAARAGDPVASEGEEATPSGDGAPPGRVPGLLMPRRSA
jgi:hypothetical protein